MVRFFKERFGVSYHSLWCWQAMVLSSVVFLAGPIAPAKAEIDFWHDIMPADPNIEWNNSENGYVGFTSAGSMTINQYDSLSSNNVLLGYEDGSSGIVNVYGSLGGTAIYVGESGSGALNIGDEGVVNSTIGYIGYSSGASGTVTIGGTGWNYHWTTSDLYVGYQGHGDISVTSGGSLSSTDCYIGYDCQWLTSNSATVSGAGSYWNNSGRLYVGYSNNAAASAMLNVDVGGIISTHSLFVPEAQLGQKLGTIYTDGIVTDANITFDSSSSLIQTLFGCVHLDQNYSGDLGVGWNSSGSLSISNGTGVGSSNGYLGYHSWSSGTASVDSSTWSNTESLYVGYSGFGKLDITNGGYVSTSGTASCYIGYNSNSAGWVTVDGSGSILRAYGGSLYVGCDGAGTLDVQNGGTVWVGHGPPNSHLYVGYSSAGFLHIQSGSRGTVSGDTYVGLITHADPLDACIQLNNGTLDTRSLFASPGQIIGTGGTITTHGLLTLR